MAVSAAGGAPGVDAVTPSHDLRGLLRITPFRRLWMALSLSSLGDWLGLLALTSLAAQLARDSYAAANVAIAGVFILRLLPAVVLGPIAGVVADRFDRRATMVVCDVIRALLFLSIPVVGTLWWLLVATLLVESAALFWIPAKEASVPNLVPRERLEAANQLGLVASYGTAPIAAALFTVLALLVGILDSAIPLLRTDPVSLALVFNGITFLVSAAVIFGLRDIPPRTRGAARPSTLGTIAEGWRFIGSTPLVRGLVAGMLGAFAAGGAVVGLGRTFVGDLGAGDPGYGLLFGAVFSGLAVGMLLGPRLLVGYSRRHLFGLSICLAGLLLAALALIPHMVAAALLTFGIGAAAGVAWVTGYTLLGLEVDDEVRGRTFAFVQSMVRVVLVVVLALAPLLAAAFGTHQLRVSDALVLNYNGAAITFFFAGLLAALLGIASYRQMADRRGIPVAGRTGGRAMPHLPHPSHPSAAHAPHGPRTQHGYLVAVEGGEAVGKSTQVLRIADWLQERGHDVVVTHEPGATDVGVRLREVLLAGAGEVDARAEALLFAADRADHVARVVRPALERGAVVVTDRFLDSSAAYQGAGRALPEDDIRRLSSWATDGLRPDVVVVLDLPPEVALARVAAPDRMEQEPLEFHERVRASFLEAAARDRARYVVVDAAQHPDLVTADVQAALRDRVPPSPRELEELAAAEAARRAEEERRRAEAEARARAAAEVARQRAELRRAEEAERRRADAEAKAAARERARQRKRLEEQRRAEDRERERARQDQQREDERRRTEEARRLAAERRALDERRRAAERAAATGPGADEPTATFPVVDAGGAAAAATAPVLPPPVVPPAPAVDPFTPPPARLGSLDAADGDVSFADHDADDDAGRHGGGDPEAAAADPTLLDELLGPGDPFSDPDVLDDRTVQLPRVTDDR